MAHNESIIQWMVAVIIGCCTLLVFRSLFAKKSSDAPSTVGLDDGIRDLLKKVLDQTTILEKAMMTAPAPIVAATPPPTPAAGTAAPAPAPVASGIDAAELEKLKKLIEERDQELNRIKSDPMAGKLRDQIDKIQELQNRLKEYEILEDDIADLSLYKEENARLKAELQRLVGGAAAAPEAKGEALVDQFAKVVDQTKGMETPAPSTEGVTHLAQTGDPMADFASAVQKENVPAAPEASETPEVSAEAVAAAPSPAPAPAAPEPAAAPAPTPAVAQAAPSGEPAQATDLFAEFSTGSLDTDRVMEELVSLEKLPAADGKDALEGDVDADKMVAEAAGFSKN